MAIKTIVCCCGMGMGTSLLAKMNIEKALKNIGVSGVSVEHCTLSEAKGSKYDLYVVSKDLAEPAASLSSVLILDNILSVKEAETKLKEAFGLS
jgi:PTS system ascorbate-specific IIB component